MLRKDQWFQFWMWVFFGKYPSHPDIHMEWIVYMIHPCVSRVSKAHKPADNDNGE